MRNIPLIILFLVTCFYTCGQTGEAIYSLSGDKIVGKSKFIDTNYIDSTSSPEPYIIKKTDTLFMSDLYGSFQLKLSKFNGYNNEPELCNVVEIVRNDITIFQLENSNGYANISSYVSTESGSYSLVRLAPETHILIFNEWIYASQPSMVSMILIYKGSARLVFNKPMFINSITKQTDHSLNILLQSNTVEYGGTIESPVVLDTPELHTIWWDGNVLRYE